MQDESDVILQALRKLCEFRSWLIKVNSEGRKWAEELGPLESQQDLKAYLPGGVYALVRLSHSLAEDELLVHASLLERGLNLVKHDRAKLSAFKRAALDIVREAKKDCPCDSCQKRRNGGGGTALDLLLNLFSGGAPNGR